MAHRNSCFCEVRKLDNEHLKMLLKETHKIAMFDVPKSYPQSDTMQHLFDLENADCSTWADQFFIVKKAIEVEILRRIKTDNW